MPSSRASISVAPFAAVPLPALVPVATHMRLEVATTSDTAFVDLTGSLEEFVAQSGVEDGLLGVQTLHTTTGLVLNEDEPLLREDILRQLERLAPADVPYAHDDPTRRRVNLTPGERVNGHAHCRALALGASVSLSVADGTLQLGRWQRVLLVDFDGPQRRRVIVTIVGVRR